ncbi:mycofactocin-coupled SDR family oxidoreductase [Gordonia sp. ABKF26]|uniref:mycofactocin-coupled SDR family oxidoreductase n=1 Tax=Gordonia sp. ABKF26 TaxID=3238687 RepID=UPI0034E3D82C
MGRLTNKVALVTGAARGQGRAHAIRLAQEGADIIAADICAPVTSAPYATGELSDLEETAKLVEQHDRRILHRQADIRDLDGLQSLVANAGIASYGPAWELTEDQWQEMLDINLTGTWKTTKAAIPSMIERGQGGSIILTSSVAGLIAYANLAHYTAAKHGVTGLMRVLSVELAPHNIRVNSVHPTTVNTPMINNEAIYNLFFPGVEDMDKDKAAEGFIHMNGLRVPWVEPEDISNAVLFLASDEARYVTGTTQVVDAGGTAPYRIPHTA